MVWSPLSVHYSTTLNDEGVYKATSIIREINEAAIVVLDTIYVNFIRGVARK